MADVFISYHKKSAFSLAVQICNELEKAGIVCWYAPRDEKPGHPYMDSIIEAIEECKVFLLILNQGANQSRAVFREVHTAYENEDNGVIILPFWAEHCELRKALRFILSPLQSVDSHCPPNAEDVLELVKQIALLLGKEPPKPQPVQPPRKQDRKELASQVVLSFFKPQPIQPSGNIIERGKCGQNVIFTLDDNGTLNISGVGPMQDYAFKNYAQWYGKRHMIVSIRVQSGVKSIGNWSFYGCTNLTSIEISDSVISIGYYAFCDCHNLTYIDIPDSVTSIGLQAFEHCNKLKSVSVPAKASISKFSFPQNAIVTRRF